MRLVAIIDSGIIESGQNFFIISETEEMYITYSQTHQMTFKILKQLVGTSFILKE